MTTMHRRNLLVSIILLLILLAVVLVPVAYSLRLQDSGVFWDNAMSNLLATAVALIVGIPIALWLDRLATARERKREEESQRKREKEFLALLKDELSLNLKFVEERESKPDHMAPFPFKPDFWDVAKSSGDLRLVSSRKLLDQLVDVYYLIRVVRRIEEQAYRALRSATVSFGSKTAVQLLVEDAQRYYEPLKTALKGTLQELEAHEKSLV